VTSALSFFLGAARGRASEWASAYRGSPALGQLERVELQRQLRPGRGLCRRRRVAHPAVRRLPAGPPPRPSILTGAVSHAERASPVTAVAELSGVASASLNVVPAGRLKKTRAFLPQQAAQEADVSRRRGTRSRPTGVAPAHRSQARATTSASAGRHDGRRRPVRLGGRCTARHGGEGALHGDGDRDETPVAWRGGPR